MQRRRLITSAPVALAGALLVACGQAKNAPSNAASPQGRFATIELEKGGSFTFQLFPDDAAKTVQNFVDKANAGFYNGLIFHRVEDWVVQGGDPRGTGTGGGTMASEMNKRPFTPGSVGIARGQDIRINNDSQFFICKSKMSKDQGQFLTGQYTNFGQVTDGMSVVDNVQIGDKIKRITIKS
ncbi:MAG: peptidylprolyl isomerase [Gaiellales bacterium]